MAARKQTVKLVMTNELAEERIVEVLKSDPNFKFKLNNIQYLVNQKADVKKAGGVTPRFVRARLQDLAKRGKVRFVNHTNWIIPEPTSGEPAGEQGVQP